MTGQKFSKDKLPWYQVIFDQFPLALEEVIRASNGGHLKYLDHGDEDWQNFSRVPDAKNQYLNAAMRHLKESKNHTFDKDMSELDPNIRHLAQFIWNGLAALEVEMRNTPSQEEIKANLNYHLREIENKTIDDFRSDYAKSISQYLGKDFDNLESLKQYLNPEEPVSASEPIEDFTWKDALGLTRSKSWLEVIEEEMKKNQQALENKFVDSLYDKGGNKDGLLNQMKPISEVMQNIGRMTQEVHNGITNYNPAYFSRPTLSVGELLDREDYHPDQEI